MAGITKGRFPRLRQLSSHVTRSVIVKSAAENTEREREREGSYETGLARKEGREGASFMRANYANCVIASRLQSRRMTDKRERERSHDIVIALLALGRGTLLAEPDDRNNTGHQPKSSSKLENIG